ncbi:MAG: SpoIIE family protein phosphatase [Methyloprofundus sp.]|nr:SpoIIE family protein phosphatase [Methyloprofundus sp.]
MSAIPLMNDFIAAAASDCGLQRELNEDSYGLDAELGLLLLADGMGGLSQGDVASSEAIQRFTDSMQALTTEPQPSFWQKLCQYLQARKLTNTHRAQLEQQAKQLIEDLLQATHNELVELNRQLLPSSNIMGTTLVGVWLWSKLPSYALIFHVGDSRAYRYRDGQLEQLTTDHSLYQQWLDGDQAEQRPAQNILHQALGVVEELQADVSLHQLRDDDHLLLCSDGLTTMVEDHAIQQLMAQLTAENLEQSCQDLIKLANANGGLDNISVILSCHQ